MPPRSLVLPSIDPVPLLFRSRRCFFHTTRILFSDAGVDHYKVLGLESNASPTDIKKKFYTLSKHHHPDHNPSDPHASDRFVKISEAYAVLGNAQKREKYDRETLRSSPNQSHNVPRGSHSSSSTTPYGARPASGLSRRRTQFRGPPPSFFRNGGWGAHGAKRQRQADSTASNAQASSSSSSNDSAAFAGPGGAGGFGPSSSASDGWDYDVSHFDRDGHIRTQEHQDQRRRRKAGEEAVECGDGGNMIFNFLWVGGVLAVACIVPTVFAQGKSARRSGDED
ncbi:MAG: hypothetical protein Q9183_002315 [Haloplaca sp. 2 TL-2023]